MSWNFRNWPGRPLTVLRFCFVRSPRKHRSRSGTRKSNRWSSKGTQNLLHNLLDCEECKWVFKTCYPLKEFSRRAIVTIISALVHSTQSEKRKKNRGESKCETTCDLYINHIICHTSIISKRCANAQIYINIIPLQCFRNMNLLSIYWQEHNVCSVQRLSELGERTTTTRFGLKRRPVDHLDGHDMTHF